jgi:hypothetical protein
MNADESIRDSAIAIAPPRETIVPELHMHLLEFHHKRFILQKMHVVGSETKGDEKKR